MTMFINTYPIDIGDNLEMTVGDLIEEAKTMGYDYPELYYQGDYLSNPSHLLSDLGIGPECVVNMINGWTSCLFINENDPHGDVAIVIDKELMVSYHLSLRRRSRKYSITRQDDGSYRADELLMGREFADETTYEISSDEISVRNLLSYYYDEDDEYVVTTYTRHQEYTIKDHRYSSIHNDILDELKNNYSHFGISFEDSDSD